MTTAPNNLNENIIYEKFVQEIYQTLLDSREIKSINVQQNVELEGRSGCKHQIDVYWQYNIGDITYQVAIECKNYNTSNISIGKIRDFYAALVDIGNIKGIFVCKEGYQRGAKKFAEYYNIDLRELRVPKDSDWDGRIQEFQLLISAVDKEITGRKLHFDEEWFKEQITPPSEGYEYQIGNDMDIYDANEVKITDLRELENALPHNWEEEVNKNHTYEYESAYISLPLIGKIKILAIEYIYNIKIPVQDKVIIDAKGTAKAILKNVSSGEINFVNQKGTIY